MNTPEIPGLNRVPTLLLSSVLGPEAEAYGAGDPALGLVLIGRAFGRAVRPRIVAALEALPPQSVLPIDCTGARLVDASFGDEVFVKLVKMRSAGLIPDRWFVLTGVGEEMEENLGMVCRLAGVVIPFAGGVLGDLGNELRATYEMAVGDGFLTSRRLADRAQLALTAASNRLARLEEAGLLASVDARGVEGGARQRVMVPVA